MKNLINIAIAAIFAAPALAQPVSDRGVIPVAVTLNQILRLNISNGGNIEFVFNQISQYETGINAGGADPFYQSDFQVSSSTNWQLEMGAEDVIFTGMDNPVNTMALNNVGYQITDLGTNTLLGGQLSDPDLALTSVVDLPPFPTATIGVGLVGNGGDGADNLFRIDWRCGTTEGTMNPAFFIDQVPSVPADRYVTNVLLELTAL